MYKISNFRISQTGTRFIVSGKKCAFEFQIQFIENRYTYCVYLRSGDDKEIDAIVNQLTEDNNLYDL